MSNEKKQLNVVIYMLCYTDLSQTESQSEGVGTWYDVPGGENDRWTKEQLDEPWNLHPFPGIIFSLLFSKQTVV